MSESRIIYTPRKELPRPTKKRRVLIVGIALWVFVLAGGFFYLLRLPDWQVKEIGIFGNTTLSSENLIAAVASKLEGEYFFLLPRNSYFLVRSKKIEHSLKISFPKIKKVDVERKFPKELLVRIEEREFWGIYCSGEVPRCVYIDDTGFAYAEAPESQGSLLRKIKSDGAETPLAGNAVMDESRVRFLKNLSDRTRDAIGSETVAYYLLSALPREVRLETNEGFQLYFDVEADLEKTFIILRRIFEEEIKDTRSEIEHIDLRFGNKVFYK